MFAIFLKALLAFIIIQQLAYRTQIRGLIVNWRWLYRPWMAFPGLVLFLLLYTSAGFAEHWMMVLLPVVLFSLILASLFPTPGYPVEPAKKTSGNGIEYYVFPAYIPSPKKAVVFFHGSGNDALFDNYELFTQWHQSGAKIISVNLPGHGLGGNTLLDPKTCMELMRNTWKNILEELPKGLKFMVVGESLGAKFALLTGLQQTEVEEAHLMCYPICVRLGFLGVLWEGIHFFGFQLWWRLKSNTFWGAIPSFSRFKRRFYPVRSAETGPLLGLYSATIDALEAQLISMKSIFNQGLKVKIFHGLLDGAIPQGQARELQHTLDKLSVVNDCYFFRSAHLSIKKWYTRFITNNV